MAFTLVMAGAAMLVLQSGEAAVAGAVIDAASGDPLGGAVVMLTDIDRTVTTDRRGRYRIRGVPPGPQHLSVRFLGYAPRTLHALVPAEGELEITVALSAVPARLATVEVRPPIALRGSEPRPLEDFADRSMSIAAIRNHPLLAEPDVLEAIGGADVMSDPEAPSGLHIRGAAANQTAYLLDGFPVFNPYHASGMFGAFNPDAVGEVSVWASSMSPTYGTALGGVVDVTTRRPGERTVAQGSASVTQARMTVNGPLGWGSSGYLASIRTGFPGLLASTRDASHVKGQAGDRIATVEASLAGGTLRVLYYDSENELSAAASTLPDDPPTRNAFEWESRTMGGDWHRELGSLTVRGRAWSALGTGEATWIPDAGSVDVLAAARRDAGALVGLEHRTRSTSTSVAMRLERSGTSLELVRQRIGSPGSTMDSDDGVGATNRLATLLVRHRRALTEAVALVAEGTAARMSGRTYTSPGVALSWAPRGWLTLTGAYATRHQFAQSLRNDESLVGTIFPAELFIGAGASGVPVARGDHVVLSARAHPTARLNLTTQVYHRRSRGLLLTAPHTGQPFTLGRFGTGIGTSRGASLEAAMNGTRYAALVTYGWQRARVRHDGGSYTPHYAAVHRVDAGLVVFPTMTVSLRLGGTAIAGRTSTPTHGLNEWESCNLLDLGCEFSGSPETRPGEAGAYALPSYLRIDIGARKHWHIRAGGRDVSVALFGTVSNVLGRPNTLAYVTNDATGTREAIDMRPLAPLVVGLDWRF